jgi:hypothetical protein
VWHADGMPIVESYEAPPSFWPNTLSTLHGNRRNGLLQDLTLGDDELGLVGLSGGSIWDVGNLGLLGEVGELGGIGAFLGDSYDVLMNGGVGPSIVLIESPSFSEISDNVDRSEYELMIDVIPVASEAVDIRIVSVSEVAELIVDIVRSEAALEDTPSDDVAIPISYLCAPQ